MSESGPDAPSYASRRERRAAERLAFGEAVVDTVRPTTGEHSPGDGPVLPTTASPAEVPVPVPTLESAIAAVIEAASAEFEPAPADAPEHPLPGATGPAKPVEPTKAGRSARRSVGRGLLSVGALAFAAALAVGMTLPANLFGSAAPVVASELPPGIGGAKVAQQGLQVSDEVVAAEAPAARDGYSSQSKVSVIQANFQVAGVGLDPGVVPAAGSVSWPFDHAVPISSGFGQRSDGEFHYGIDLDPGAGVPAAVVADGIVTWVGWDNSGYGYYAVVAHTIDGVRVDSLYGHMIDGSSPVYPGEWVTKGTVLGLTGDTGYSFGAHLHLEIHVAGQRVDPYPWMSSHADNPFTEPLPGPP